jgi:HlyD family secretion protein
VTLIHANIMTKKLKRILWLAIAGLLIVGAGFALRPKATPAAIARVTRGPFTATLTAEGRSRVSDLYIVASPVDGDLERIPLKAGDSVPAGAIVARIRPSASRPLDPRSRATALAAVSTARAAVAQALAVQAEAVGAAVHADSELVTARRLVSGGAEARKVLERAEHEAEIRRRGVDAARAAVAVAGGELTRAEASLAPAPARSDLPAVAIRAPIAGRLLRVLRESEGPVGAATPLAEIGNLAGLELTTDLLTADAAMVQPGASATITQGSDSRPFKARVRRIEPAAFTKVSALGLEEQRVRVVLDLVDAPPAGLGHDFRVTVSIVVWTGQNVLAVPSTALFRSGARWAVFVLDQGRARVREVTPGRSDEERTVIETGLAEGDEVILQPSDAIRDGARIARAPVPR